MKRAAQQNHIGQRHWIAAALISVVTAPVAVTAPSAWSAPSMVNPLLESAPTPDPPPPEAMPDTAITKVGVAKSIAALENDRPAGESFELQSVSTPTNGSARKDHASVIYTPKKGFTGRDTFSYTIVDRYGRTATATIAVEVQPHDPPIAQPDSASVNEGEVELVRVLDNDHDPEQSGLKVTAVRGARLGEAFITPDYAIRYQPRAGADGRDTLTYTVVNGVGASATGTLTIDVTRKKNQKPIARDDSATVIAGTTEQIAVLGNDEDPDKELIRITAVTTPRQGVARIDGNHIAYTANPTASDGDSFTYEIQDPQKASARATVTVQITPANRPPVARDDSATPVAGTTMPIAVLGNDEDPDKDPIHITGVTAPKQGVARVDGDHIAYTANPTASGTDSFTYEIQDPQKASARATVTVQITPANRPPIARNDSATVIEGGAVGIPVLANDDDPDGDRVSLTRVGTPANGRIKREANNTLTYSPNPGYSGDDHFDYDISDPSGAVATGLVKVAIASKPVEPKPVQCTDQVDSREERGIAVITVTNPCRAGQDLKVKQGEWEWVCTRPFNKSGRAEFRSALTTPETKFQLSVGASALPPVRLQTKELEHRVRIVLRWDPPVDLDLHVFEPQTGKPHLDVWTRSTGSGQVTAVDADAPDCRQEVYDLISAPAPGAPQKRLKVVADYVQRQKRVTGDHCEGGRYDSVSYQFISSVYGRHEEIRRGNFSSIKCNQEMSDGARIGEQMELKF